MDDLIFQIAPSNGSARRLVIAYRGEHEVFRDETNPNRAADRERFGEQLARQLGMPLKEILPRIHTELPAAADAADQQAEELAAQAEPAWEPTAQAKAAAERLLARPDLLAHVARAAETLGVVNERKLVFLVYLAATSRLLPKPIYLLVKGEPSSGKSFITSAVARLFPPGVVLEASDLTPQALYYLRDEGLQRRVLLLGERKRQIADESVDRTKALRELVENGRLSLLVTNPKARRAERIEVEGPAAVIETCSHEAVAHEDLTRAVQAWPNDSPEQTRLVVTELARRKAHGQPQLSQEEQEALWAVQHLLEPAEVVLPFLPAIAKRFPTSRLEARRAFPRLVALAEASALLHQRQRERDAQGRIVAIEDDLRLALRVSQQWLDVSVGGGVPPRAARVWAVVREREGTFTLADLPQKLGGEKTLQRALADLEKAGALELAEEWSNGKAKVYQVIDPGWEPGTLDLGLGTWTPGQTGTVKECPA